MITINPAIMLHIDDKVGSISRGKDADLVLWSGHPLSVYSHPNMVMIDGAVYYSQKKDTELQKALKVERQRLIQAMIKAKGNGVKTQKVDHKEPPLYHCDSYEDECEF
jgi:urease alpha subunit